MTHAIMNQSIDWTSIKNGLLTGLEVASNKASQLKDMVGSLAGRLVKVIKSGMEQASPYLQNKYVAAGALFGVSCVSLTVAELVGRLVGKILPRSTQRQAAIGNVVATGISMAIWLGSVGAFCYTNALGLHPAVMIASVIAPVIFVANSQ